MLWKSLGVVADDYGVGVAEQVDVDDVPARLDELLDRVADGEEFVIAHDGQAVAQLIPVR